MRITCSCGKMLQVNDALAGKRVKCPACGAAVLARQEEVQQERRPPARRPAYEEEDEDQPRRRPRLRDEDEEEEQDDRPRPQGVSVLGILSLVFGILGAVISLFPCIGWFVGAPVAGIGLILGLIGLVVALKGKQTGTGLPIAGSAVSFLGLVIAGAWFAWMTIWARNTSQQVQQIQSQIQQEITRQEQERQREREEVRQGPALDVTASDLAREYHGNAIGADGKYRGKILAVKGQVERVSDNAFWVAVVLKTGVPNEAVECQFAPEEKNQLAGLTPGQQVTIRGKCTGRVGFNPTLEKCVLMKP